MSLLRTVLATVTPVLALAVTAPPTDAALSLKPRPEVALDDFHACFGYPGGVITVAQPGETVIAAAIGLADLVPARMAARADLAIGAAP